MILLAASDGDLNINASSTNGAVGGNLSITATGHITQDIALNIVGGNNTSRGQ